MVLALLLFLALSLLLYALLGGADFGAGILELGRMGRMGKQEHALVQRAMAPVWEANHIWLIVAVVIVFMGFPPVYTTVCTFLFIPLMCVLLGIVARGCAFVLRYYDAAADHSGLYSGIFAVSSAFCTFFLGVLAGAMTFGGLDPSATEFGPAYLSPWLNLHCAFTGVFACALFSFLAALYLSGEAEVKALQEDFQRRAAYASIGMVVAGAAVFATQPGLVTKFIETPLALSCFFLATLLMAQLWYAFRYMKATRSVRFWTRAAGAGVVAMVMLGWYSVVFPAALVFREGVLTYYEAAAPLPVLKALLIALIVGIAVIIPALIYLFKIFKWEVLE
ncbi:MAG: cytochrome d ubiquinol oxidase subunit II [Bdellovibrionota bacterium]